VTPLIQTLASCTSSDTVSATVERLHAVATRLVRGHYADAPVRLRDLDRLAATAAQASSLSGFLADLALDPPASSADYAGTPRLDEDYLTLSTVHSAKGLEWDSVHVISASDGNFPSDMALNDPDGLEEERRLFYVAITRPRKALTIYVPLRYYHHPNARDDNHGYGSQSRFLTSEAEALCERSDAWVNLHLRDPRRALLPSSGNRGGRVVAARRGEETRCCLAWTDFVSAPLYDAGPDNGTQVIRKPRFPNRSSTAPIGRSSGSLPLTGFALSRYSWSYSGPFPPGKEPAAVHNVLREDI
jgi:hypothetical protein